MGKSKNKVSLIGTVGRDAELRQTQSGVSYARFSLATSEGGYKKSDGTEVPETTQWHSVVAWRGLADMCGKYVRKGMKVAVDGKIVYGKFDKQGVECMSVEIVAEDVVLMAKPKDDGQAQQAQFQTAPLPYPPKSQGIPTMFDVAQQQGQPQQGQWGNEPLF